MVGNLKSLNKNIPWLILAGLLTIPAVGALFVPGFYGASDDVHIAWLYEMHKTLMMGQIPPRFVPDLSFGFGYPLFNFVFPLPFYIAEIFHFLGLSLVDSVKFLFFLTVPLSAFFMYFLLRQFTNKSLSLAGAILYIYTPYRSVDLYVRGAIGEIVSFVLLPLILLSILKVIKVKDLRWVGIGAIALASLVLSHNISAFMFFPFVGLFCLLQIFSIPNKKKFITRIFLMVFLAVLTSIYFWLPAIVDSNLMKYDTVFNFADHFPTFRQLITPYWGYGASVPGPYDGMSFFLGTTNLLLLIIGVLLSVLLWKKTSKDRKVILVWSLITIFSAVFLMNNRAVFIWSHIPLLPYFQFPWRFLILTTVAIPILVIVLERLPFNNRFAKTPLSQSGDKGEVRLQSSAALNSEADVNFKKKTVAFQAAEVYKFIPWILIALTLSTTASYFRPQDFLGRRDDYFINRYIPTPQASDEYKKTQEEYLRLPKDTLVRPDKNYPKITINNGILKTLVNVNDLNSMFTIESTKETQVHYNKYYFPGWDAKIDGKKVEVWSGTPFGQVSVDMPAGSHKLEVYFSETTFKKVLDFASVGAFLVSLTMVI